MASIKNYLSLIKFSHTIFAMPFAFIGFSLAADNYLDLSSVITGTFSDNSVMSTPWFWIKKLCLVLLCMVFARSAAMAFNRYLDREFDAKNPRTAIREIPAGIISDKNALWFTIANSVLFVLVTFFINELCFYLSPVALFVILFYSYTKRFTPLCHLVLGIGLSLAPIGAYLAVTGAFNWLPIFFSITVLCWVSGFDIIYALQDEGFDKAHQLYSIPAVLGKKRALMVSRLLHIAAALMVILAGIYGGFGYLYWSAVAVFTGMLLYQQSIVKPTDLSKVNIAFMTANGIASVLFALLVIADLFFHSRNLS
jgi:4-hydroxybenzoate polyprenyltransferase